MLNVTGVSYTVFTITNFRNDNYVEFKSFTNNLGAVSYNKNGYIGTALNAREN